jgi:hypothetical protein
VGLHTVVFFLKRVKEDIRNKVNIFVTDQTAHITQSGLATAKLLKQWFLTQNTDPLAPLWSASRNKHTTFYLDQQKEKETGYLI